MSTRDLAAKYGKSKNSKQLVNVAIRAELAGGNEALDALDLLRRRPDLAEGPAGRNALDSLLGIVNAMADEIRRRYDMPPREE